MTQVDFYILESGKPETCALLACRLAEKAYRMGHHVYINTESGAELAPLDDLLWTFRAGSFLPHVVRPVSPGDDTPIQLGSGADPQGMDDVLVNLAREVQPWFSRFNRVAELVGADDTARAAGRERYRFYQERGYPLNTHKL